MSFYQLIHETSERSRGERCVTLSTSAVSVNPSTYKDVQPPDAGLLVKVCA